MTFDKMIEKLMSEVHSGSNAPVIIFRDKYGGWQCDFTQNQYGEKFDWVDDLKEQDLLALEFTGKDFSNGSFANVYDSVLSARLRAEYCHLEKLGADTNNLKALINFFEDNVSAFSDNVTDYLTTIERPLAALQEMVPFTMISNDVEELYDELLAEDAVNHVEDEVYSRLNPQTKSSAKDKRVIEGYEEKYCIQLASRYVVLAENLNADFPYFVCNVRRDNPLGIEEYYDGVKIDNYVEAMRKFVKHVDVLAKTLETQRRKSGLPFQTLTADDCIPDSRNEDWEGKAIIIKPEILAPEYRSAEHQLVLCTGGFGASPHKIGRAVYVKELHGDQKFRYNRHQIAGVADLSKMPAWALDKLTELDIVKAEAVPPEKKPSLQQRLDNAKDKVQEADAQTDKSAGQMKKTHGRE